MTGGLDASAGAADAATTVPRGQYVAGGGCKCTAGAADTSAALWPALLLPIAIVLRVRRRRTRK
jgi:hypothetical protein